jgi:trk system potassium uptake protein TrkH
MLAVVHVLGSMLMLFSITYILPILTSLLYRDGLVIDFTFAALGCLATGTVVARLTRRHKRELRSRDGFLLVTLGWVMMSAIATVPLMLGLPASRSRTRFSKRCPGSAPPARRC